MRGSSGNATAPEIWRTQGISLVLSQENTRVWGQECHSALGMKITSKLRRASQMDVTKDLFHSKGETVYSV